MNMSPIDLRKTREWITSNDLGSFAMGSLDRVPLRKYHGLWISRAVNQPHPQHLLLDVIERQIISGSQTRALVDYDFGEGVGSVGRSLIQEFDQNPTPKWTYDLGDGCLTRTLRWLTPHDVDHCLEGIELKYRWKNSRSDLYLSFEPIFTFRDIHSLGIENSKLRGIVEKIDSISNAYRFTPYFDLDEIWIIFIGESQVKIQGNWYKNFHYRIEHERGYPSVEDGFCPLQILAKIAPDSEVAFQLILPDRLGRPQMWSIHSRPWVGDFSDFYKDLSNALNAYVYSPVKHIHAQRIIAGYPWFSCWARDTLITLPGLSLSSRFLSDSLHSLGMLNDWIPILEAQLFGFPKTDEDLNATGIDAPWLWGAALRFLVEQHPKKISRQHPFIQKLTSRLEAWILRCFRGNSSRVEVTDLGLLCKPGETSVSWMDAVVEGIPVTPRSGYPVEINAMFFDAIDFLLEFHLGMDDGVSHLFQSYLKNIREQFSKKFWVDSEQWIADGHDGIVQDSSLRPNQLWCLTSRFELFSDEQACLALDHITKDLLTPLGLRTLSPRDSRYQGVYLGNQAQRDHAYHQGTVWPWLLGKYTEAILKYWGKDRAQTVLDPIFERLKKHFYEEACLGQISEIFDGNLPHFPRGAPAQAWSVAEVLRSLWLLENSKY